MGTDEYRVGKVERDKFHPKEEKSERNEHNIMEVEEINEMDEINAILKEMNEN